MRIFIGLVGGLVGISLVGSMARGEVSPPIALKEHCTSAREYVTALEYLRDHKDFALTEAAARKLADDVSLGCSEAARRFVRGNELLIKAGVPVADALKTSVQLAQMGDEKFTAFTDIFSAAYASDGLDLDVRAALETARDLSVSFAGSSEYARQDFEAIVHFCMKERELALPKYRCAELAKKVAIQNEGFDRPLSPAFRELFQFITTGLPGRSTGEALRLAEEIVGSGPQSAENFAQAYKYAVASGGLQMPVNEALAFAKQMALRSSLAPEKRGAPATPGLKEKR
ncbi:MAG: hypothetical protein AB7P04_05925 [Bacteriovoracia bacterium]